MRYKQGISSAVVAGGTSQIIADKRQNRAGLIIQNTSDIDLWINFDKEASAASPSLKLIAGEKLDFSNPPDNEIHLFGATTGKTFSLWEA